MMYAAVFIAVCWLVSTCFFCPGIIISSSSSHILDLVVLGHY